MEKEILNPTEQDPAEIRFTDEWWKARENELAYLPEPMRPAILMGFIRVCGSM